MNKAVATYQAIGMEDEYVRCIQEFASLEVSGQLGGGSSLVSFGSGSGLSGLFGGYGSGGSSSGSSSGGLGGSALSGLLESLGGGSGSSYSSIGSGYSGEPAGRILRRGQQLRRDGKHPGSLHRAEPHGQNRRGLHPGEPL